MQPRGQLIVSVDNVDGSEKLLPRSPCCASPTFSIDDILASSFHVCPSVDISSAEPACDTKLKLPRPDHSLLDRTSQQTHCHQPSGQIDTSYSQPHSPLYPNVCRKNKDSQDDLNGFPPIETSIALVTPRPFAPKLQAANEISTPPANTSLNDSAYTPRTSVGTRRMLVQSDVFRVDIPGALHNTPQSTFSTNSVEQIAYHSSKDSTKANVSCSKCGSYVTDSEPRVSPAITDTLNILIDAARCVRAEAQLEEAEAVLEHLIAKFAEPSDLCTSWENLTNEPKWNEDAGKVNPKCSGACETPSLAAVSFSPIFKLLLSQPGAHIFPDLYRPTAPGRKLQELCNQLASAIRRTKRKLRVLQRMKTGQPRTSRVKEDVRLNTAENAHLLSSHNRRMAFVDRLRNIWPGFRESDTLGSTGKQMEIDGHPSLSIRLPKPSPHVYTNPMECPLSLLSFVSNLIDPRIPHSDEAAIPHGIKRKMPDETHPSANLQLNNEQNCILKPLQPSDVKENSTNGKLQRSYDDESKWPTVTKCSAITSLGTGLPTTLSFCPSSRSPSSCSTYSYSQRGSTKRSLLRTGHGTQLTRVQHHSPPELIESVVSSSDKTSRSRRRSYRRTSDLTRSKRKRSVREVTRHSTSLTNVHPVKLSVQKHSEPSENPVTITAPQSTTNNPSNSPLPSNPLQSTWTELNIVVRDTEPSVVRLHWEGKPDYTGPMSISAIHSPSATSDNVTTHSAPCMSFTDSSSTTSQLMLDRSMDFLSPSGHGDSGHLSSDEPGWSNTTRPPTPDIRRSDLDVTDLSDGTRVLIIEDTHLRAGTLYLCRPLSFSSFSTENRREYLFRIHLDSDRNGASALSAGFTPNRRSTSPNRGHESPTSITPKKRRQSDLLLHGWQVIQQAVLEVFPTSLRHLPPGTRVCAAWSEQLASNLYPGTVVEAEGGDQVQPGCVCVDFDDGDHRQVSLHNIRLLPDHFVNLHQLANEAGVDGLVTHLISPARVLPEEVQKTCAGTARIRVRSHSAVSEELHASIAVLTAKRDWNRTIRGRRIGPPSTIGTIRHNHVFANSDHSPGTPELGRPEVTTPKASVPSDDLPVRYSSGLKVEPLLNLDARGPVVSPTADPEVPFDTVSTASDSSDSRGWSILEKFKRKKHGRICCRSIVRETDGSVVSIGDAVEFSSENDEVYLGEVREIHWNEAADNLVVIAAWFYHPTEIGSVGSQLIHLKGALFATAHRDENEARCINRRITVFNSYAEYRHRIGIGSEMNTDEEIGVGGKTDSSMNPCSGPQTTILPDPFGFGDIQDARSNTTSENTEDTVYFIAGKYDPVNRRVLSWDPDVEKLIKREK